MTRATRFALTLLGASSSCLALATPTRALAEPPSTKATPVYVLTISTDDADDQAEALTQALRSRVRLVQGWSLLESAQSFETLAIGLKCPPKPDAACLGRIADQLHGDHIVWGTMAKGRSGQVTANLHLWSRGSGSIDTTQAYTDNLKDGSDESLRAIATTLFAKLSGGTAGGTFVVHAGHGGGTVLIDGEDKGVLDGGIARIDAPPGSHAISVKVHGFEAEPQTASVGLGAEKDLNFVLAPGAKASGDTTPHAPFPTRQVLSWSAIVVGGVLLIVSGVEAARYFSDKSDGTNDKNNAGGLPANCEGNGIQRDWCQKGQDAITSSTIGWVTGLLGAGLAATGVYLLVTDRPSTEAPPPGGARVTPRPGIEVVPAVGLQGGSLGLRVIF